MQSEIVKLHILSLKNTVYSRVFMTEHYHISVLILLAVGFVFQCKVLYQAYQKRLRFNEYNEMIDEMTHSLQAMESVINRTDNMMRILKRTVKIKSRKTLRVTTQTYKSQNSQL